MDARRRECVCEVFSLATQLLDRMHEQAVDGQSPHISEQSCLKISEHLRAAAADLLILADAMPIIVGFTAKRSRARGRKRTKN
jgi:hypothetical protein